MGRKPNPLILEYFVRGPKLNDNSNRYPHTCKSCGESFPKGRIDSLTTHIARKCPAISESDRMRVCLELHGLAHARAVAAHERNQAPDSQSKSTPAFQLALSQNWSALETLAEASRQVDLNEHNRDKDRDDAASPTDEAPVDGEGVISTSLPGQTTFELQEPYTLDNPPENCDTGAVNEGNNDVPNGPSSPALVELTPEERLQALLPATRSSSPAPSSISVAVAATARLNPSFLDPQLVQAEPPIIALNVEVTQPLANPQPTSTSAPSSTQPWGEMTYFANATPSSMLSSHFQAPLIHKRGGVRMDTADAMFNGRPRQARSRFTAARRKEVQEIRKIGACIRCRILRKNCGRGTPCETCKKVLSPRVWKTGCVRSRLNEQLDLYSAGVQVVLSQNRVNLLKEQLRLSSNNTMIEVSHFPETGHHAVFKTLIAVLEPTETQATTRANKEPFPQTVMIDQAVEDVPEEIERYMRQVLPLFIEREPSKFMRVTLETANERLVQQEDEALRKAVDLWGFVESIDRERQWTFLERPGAKGEEPGLVKDTHKPEGADVYTMICMQLNAAAERKANSTSHTLLSLMDRLLTDSRSKIGFNMFLTALILLNCIEKSTWAFKAWEQDHLRPGWPLARDPSTFVQQGAELAGLMKMLLAIRKILPQTGPNADGKLRAEGVETAIARYFERLDLDYDSIEARQQDFQFSPADSRSLELTFCSHLLLPNQP